MGNDTKTTVDRRRFVQGVGATLVSGPAFIFHKEAQASGSLFTLGVCSGDPNANSVVLWTRLAPDPLNGGGLGHKAVKVHWEVAYDRHMRHVIRRGATVALPQKGHAVHVIPRGLPSNCWLYYRFYAKGQYSRVGRTRTFPSRWDYANHMRFATVSCQNYEQGFYNAYADMLSQNLDFVVHTGDYMYEGAASTTPLVPGRVHNGPESVSVDDYRNRYALYRLDPDLQDVHAELPFLVTFDDHEVENNYAGKIPEETSSIQGQDFIDRRRNAYQVYAETMPLRPQNRAGARSGRINLFRRLQFGNLADIHMLDTRQFRTDQPALDNFGSTDNPPADVAALLESVLGEKIFDEPGINDPGATMLGIRQELWLARNLARSKATWNVLAQQVMQMEWNLRATGEAQVALDPTIPEPLKTQILAAYSTVSNLLAVDAWDGYPAARDRLFHVLDSLRPNNPVVLTGDIHSSWASNLFKDFKNPGDMIAAEFVCTSIASTFLTPDPRPTDFIVRQSIPENPHIAYFNALFRGYALCDVNRHRWQTEFRRVGTLADLSNPSPDALIPLPGKTVETDRIVEIESGFNQPGSTKRLNVI